MEFTQETTESLPRVTVEKNAQLECRRACGSSRMPRQFEEGTRLPHTKASITRKDELKTNKPNLSVAMLGGEVETPEFKVIFSNLERRT